MNRLLTIIFFLTVPYFSFSQILNIEKYRLDKDTFNIWMGNVGLGFNSKKQQTNVLTFNGNLNVAYLSKKHSYMTINYIKFINVASDNVISEGYTHVRFNFFRHNRISIEPFVQLQYDIGRGLYKRGLMGQSFRLSIHSKERYTLSFATGAFYEYELWKGDVLRFGDENRPGVAETNFIKSTSNIALRLDLHKSVNLFLVTYYQARFNHFFKPRVISDLQVVFNLGRHFSISNQFVSTFDAYPITTANKFIFSFNSALMFKF